ncbi:MAG: hypothetical protein AAGF11_11490 [Myxococcota bacterium]
MLGLMLVAAGCPSDDTTIGTNGSSGSSSSTSSSTPPNTTPSTMEGTTISTADGTGSTTAGPADSSTGSGTTVGMGSSDSGTTVGMGSSDSGTTFGMGSSDSGTTVGMGSSTFGMGSSTFGMGSSTFGMGSSTFGMGSSESSTGGSESSTGFGSTGTTGGMGPCEVMTPMPGMCAGPGMDPVNPAITCNPITQDDCPAGEKCMPVGLGGGSWDATMCVAIDPAPVAVGDVCDVVGNATSGLDNCDIGAMCWNVDGATLQGTCIELCSCSYDNPQCVISNAVCAVVNSDVLPLCIPVCNPLDPTDCAANEGCYPVGAYFQCAPDASGMMGVQGDPCEFINVCDNGLICVEPALIPGCIGASGCCTATCDVNDPAPGCPVGTDCVPYYPGGGAPDMCLEDVGVCAIP